MQVARAIEAGTEFQTREVQALYQNLLQRNADAGGLAGFTGFLAAGGTIAQVEANLLGSAEFFQDAGGTNAGFVAALYQDVLTRPADVAGAAAWQAALDRGQTRASVAAGYLQSNEAETLALEALYQQYLHRPADQGGLSVFLSALQHGATQEQITADILGSAEYFNGPR